MTKNDRILKIEQYSKQRQREEMLLAKVLREIEKMSGRIAELIEVADACMKAGIKLEDFSGTIRFANSAFQPVRTGNGATSCISQLYMCDEQNKTAMYISGAGELRVMTLSTTMRRYLLHEVTISDKDMLRLFVQEFFKLEKELYEYIDGL